MVELDNIREICKEKDISPIYIFPCGSRRFGLDTARSDYDFVTITENRVGHIQLYNPKIDIFVRSQETVHKQVYELDSRTLRRNIDIFCTLLWNDWHFECDVDLLCRKHLKAVYDQFERFTRIGYHFTKTTYYAYLLYYAANNGSTKLTPRQQAMAQKAHDCKLTEEDVARLKRSIGRYVERN